jgi:uncharacterized protein YggE
VRDLFRPRRAARALPLIVAAALAAACSGDAPKAAGDASAQPESASLGSSASGGGGSGARVALGSTGGLDTTPRGVPGLTVRGTGTGTAPADQAFVVLTPAPQGVDSLVGGGVSPQDRRRVVDALSPLGIQAEDVTFPTEPRYGGSRVRVKVPTDQLPATGPKVVDAVERVLGRSRSAGAAFGLSDCEPATVPVRRQASEQAEAQARSLADATRTGLGTIVAVAQDLTSQAAPLPRTAADGCPAVVDGDLEAFDARPQVKLSVGLTVTYAIAGAPAAGAGGRPQLVAAGSSTTKAKADEAYVVLAFESQDDTVPPGPSKRDRDRVLDAVAKLGVDRKSVVFATSDYPARIVQIETRAAGLEKSGRDLVRAVEDVLGRSDSTGARFVSSTCKALLAKARKDATADARQRAVALAEASGVKLGDLQGVAESTGFGVDPCDDGAASVSAVNDYGSPLQPFDAEPEVAVPATVSLSFGLA